MITPDSNSQATTSLKNIASACFRHRGAFALTALTILGITILVTAFTPRQYQSDMSVMVQNSRVSDLITPQATAGPNTATPPSPVTDDQINSEMAVLGSKDIADNVIDPGWVAAAHTDAEIRQHEKSVARLTHSISVELEQHSDIIRVSYTDASPHRAQQVLSRLLAVFLAKQRDLEHPGGTSAFFADAANRAKAELDEAQQQLSDYQQQRQMVSLPDKESTLEKQITDLQDQQRAADAQIAEAEGRLSASRAQMQSVPARENTEQRSVPSSMSVDQLNVMLTDLQNKRTELLTKYPPTERLVLEIDDKIATTTAALQSARQNSMQENATNVNPVWEQVNSGAAQATTDIQALRNRSNHLGMQIAMLRGNLNGVESSTVDYTTLQQKVTELQANYQVYAQKRDQAQMADAMDQQHLLNVAVVQQPTLSTTPVRPQPVNNLILGGFTAVFLGMCVIFFAEMGRDTIASPQELEAVSSHPVLATVPFTRGERTSGLLPPERGKPLPPGFFSPPTGSGMRAAKTPAAVLASASTAMSAHPASAFEPKPAQAASASGNHWETLRTLLTQMPAAAVQNASPAPLEHRPWETVGEAPVSLPREPLLESEPQKPAVQTPIITRSTVDHFPLPSVVPQQIASGLHAIASGVRSDVSSGDKPVATTVEAKPKQEIPPAPIETASATHELKQETTPNPQKQESPQSATDAPQASAPVHESRKSAILHEKLQNNWAENVAQRILGQRGSRSSAASLPTPEPRRNGAAEVVYNRQGKVEYVTYTVNPRNTDSRFGRIR